MKTIKLLLFIFTVFFYFSFSLSQVLPWQEITPITNVSLRCVITPKTYNLYPAWACGDNGTVIRTSGISPTSWTNVSGNGLPSNINFVTIGCNTMNTALVAGNIGSNTYVYRTTNNGANWSQVFTQTGGAITSLSFGLNTDYTNFVFMAGTPVGGRWSVWKSTNSGLNWDSAGIRINQLGSEYNPNNTLWTDMSSNAIWFGTNSNRIYYSSNGGNSWSIQSVPDTIVTSIWFNGPTGYASGTSLFKTTNSGVNWAMLSVPGSGLFTGIGGTPNGSNLEAFTRGTNTIYYANGASNWLTYTASSGNYTFVSSIRALTFWAPQYALRDNGGMSFRYFFPEAIQKISDGVPNSFSLKNNYPNPFNPGTIIEYQLPVNSIVRLSVFDISGKEVGTLVNEMQSAGTYRASFDGSKLSSGIYFYRLETERFSETKKMILIK